MLDHKSNNSVDWKEFAYISTITFQISNFSLSHNSVRKWVTKVTKNQIYPALVAQWDYEQQIQVAVLNDEPTVDQIPLEAMNLCNGRQTSVVEDLISH